MLLKMTDDREVDQKNIDECRRKRDLAINFIILRGIIRMQIVRLASFSFVFGKKSFQTREESESITPLGDNRRKP